MTAQLINNDSDNVDDDHENILPVDKQKVKGKFTHVIMVVPALDRRWVAEKTFGYYVFPPSNHQNNKNTKEVWIECMNYVLDDIWWLCELQYHKFWSQIIFDSNAINGIKSFLHLAPLQKLYYRIEDCEILSVYKSIKKAVFQFFKRLSRLQESELHFMTEEKYREIISNNDLINISLVFCICSVYGKKQKEDIGNIVSHLFKYSPSLRLDKAVLRTIQLFSYLKKKLKIAYRDLRRNIEFSEDSEDICNLIFSYRNCLVSAVQFLGNVAMNISNFLSVYNPACIVFSNYNFEYHIVRVYKKLLVPLHQELNMLFNDVRHEQNYYRLISMLNITRSELINVYIACLNSSLNKLKNREETYDVIQQYMNLMKFSLKVKEFILDFTNVNSISEISETIKKAVSSNIDTTDIDRICETMNELCDLKNGNDDINNFNEIKIINLIDHNVDIDGNINDETGSESADYEIENNVDVFNFETSSIDGSITDDELSSSYSDWSKNDNSDSEYDGYLATDDDECEDHEEFQNNETERARIDLKISDPSLTHSNYMPEMDIESPIAFTQVKNIFPHLGDGFIWMCLKHYKMDASSVINAILESSLPVELKTIDFNLAYVPGTVTEKVEDKSESRNSRNYFQEYGLKELKKTDYSSYQEMFDDKEGITTAKDIYEKYKTIEDDDTLYDDDVDEEFDERTVAALEVDPEGFYDSYTEKPNKRNYGYEQEVEIFDSNSESGNSGTKTKSYSNFKKPLDFCENPEDVRARMEQKRRTMDEKRFRSRPYKNHSTGSSKKGNQNDNVCERSGKNLKNENYRDEDTRYEKYNDTRKINRNNISRKTSYENVQRGDRNRGNYEENNADVKKENQSKNFKNADYHYKYTNYDNGSKKGNQNYVNKEKPYKNDQKEDQDYDDYEEHYKGAESQTQNFVNEYYQNKNANREKFNNNLKSGNQNEVNRERHFNDVQNDQSNDERRHEDVNKKNNSENVSKERHYKTVHKSRSANHNRRFLSDRKRRF